MNYLDKLKKQLKSNDRLPLLLVSGMQNWFRWRTDLTTNAALFYLLISDFFILVNDWLNSKYQIVDFLDEEVNIQIVGFTSQRNSNLSKIETDLLDLYLKRRGKHTAISAMVVLGLIPYLKSIHEYDIILETDVSVKEINKYLKDKCSFSKELISKELKYEILTSEFNLKEEIA